MMEMPPLPGLPDLEAQTERVEVWGLMQDYARQYGELCARMAREQERERLAAKWEEAHGFDKYGVAAAIRAG